jgi:hypothetical protein
VANADIKARGLAIAPPRVKIVYHCFTARGAGACIAVGMLTTEREMLLPDVLISLIFLKMSNTVDRFHDYGMY